MAPLGHRWERDITFRIFQCVRMPLGGVESGQWCVGCGCVISDKEVREVDINTYDRVLLRATLDSIAHKKGFHGMFDGDWQTVIYQASAKFTELPRAQWET